MCRGHQYRRAALCQLRGNGFKIPRRGLRLRQLNVGHRSSAGRLSVGHDVETAHVPNDSGDIPALAIPLYSPHRRSGGTRCRLPNAPNAGQGGSAKISCFQGVSHGQRGIRSRQPNESVEIIFPPWTTRYQARLPRRPSITLRLVLFVFSPSFQPLYFSCVVLHAPHRGTGRRTRSRPS